MTSHHHHHHVTNRNLPPTVKDDPCATLLSMDAAAIAIRASQQPRMVPKVEAFAHSLLHYLKMMMATARENTSSSTGVPTTGSPVPFVNPEATVTPTVNQQSSTCSGTTSPPNDHQVHQDDTSNHDTVKVPGGGTSTKRRFSRWEESSPVGHGNQGEISPVKRYKMDNARDHSRNHDQEKPTSPTTVSLVPDTMTSSSSSSSSESSSSLAGGKTTTPLPCLCTRNKQGQVIPSEYTEAWATSFFDRFQQKYGIDLNVVPRQLPLPTNQRGGYVNVFWDMSTWRISIYRKGKTVIRMTMTCTESGLGPAHKKRLTQIVAGTLVAKLFWYEAHVDTLVPAHRKVVVAKPVPKEKTDRKNYYGLEHLNGCRVITHSLEQARQWQDKKGAKLRRVFTHRAKAFSWKKEDPSVGEAV